MSLKRAISGFTMVELITVMLIIGIMAAVAIPRFNDRTFVEKAFRDAVITAVQHGRRMAVAGRRFTCVNVTPGVGPTALVELRRDTTVLESVVSVSCSGASGVALNLPAPGRDCAAGSANQVCAPNGVTLGGSSLIFDPLGRLVTAGKVVASAAATITIASFTITIQPETGAVQ